MAAREGIVTTQAEISELNLRYVLERGARNIEDVCLAAGPSHYWPLTESDVPVIDIGYSCRQGTAGAVRTRHDMATEDGAGTITYQVTGPNGSDNAVSFSATEVRLSDASLQDFASDSAGEGGAVACFFKTGNTTTTKHIWDVGNNGGAFNHRIRLLSDGDMIFQLRNASSGFDITWTFTPPSAVDDDEWHFIYWSCDGTVWRIRLDGIDYDDGDSEVIESTSTFSQVDWWNALPPLDRGCWGNSSGTSFGQTLDGEIAHPMIWRENDGTNTNNPTTAALLRIEAAGGV